MQDIIEVKNLTKYFGDKKVLNNINFKVAKGEVLAYLGHNGAGKTTTLRIILGLIPATDGDVFLNGEKIDYNSDKFDEIRKNFGVMLDYPAFYNELTAYENLKIFAGLYYMDKNIFDKSVKELSAKLEISEALNQKLKTFSKGMRQKISFIRAIQHNPQIVFMDEPMSGLDPVARVKMRDIILDLKQKGTSFFITSHDLEEMDKISDHIIILEKGNILLSSKLKEIKFEDIWYEVKIEGSMEDKILADLNGFLKTSEFRFDKNILNFKSNKTFSLTDIVDFFNKYNIKVSDFSKRENSLEKIYFEVLKRNENK
ncbi:MAG: ABC transporter ATP-binding protein [Elusimicrobiales bacterium]